MPAPVALTGNSPQGVVIGAWLSTAIVATGPALSGGSANAKLSRSGALPAGMAWDASTGLFSGTPTALGTNELANHRGVIKYEDEASVAYIPYIIAVRDPAAVNFKYPIQESSKEGYSPTPPYVAPPVQVLKGVVSYSGTAITYNGNTVYFTGGN